MAARRSTARKPVKAEPIVQLEANIVPQTPDHAGLHNAEREAINALAVRLAELEDRVAGLSE